MGKVIEYVRDIVRRHGNLRRGAFAVLVCVVNSPPVRLWYATRLRRLVTRAATGRVWLHLACGERTFPEWINVDISPSSSGVDVLLDLRRPFPLSDSTVDLIYSEDFLEHLSLADGRRLLRECFRVLRPGGMMRLLTPNLRVLATRYVERSPELLAWYSLDYGTDYFAEIVNHGLRSWGHRFVYDDEMLAHELNLVGFIVQLAEHHQSTNPLLAGLDRGDPREAEYRMYVDCTKPSA